MAGISKEVKEEILSKIKAGAKVVDVSKIMVFPQRPYIIGSEGKLILEPV